MPRRDPVRLLARQLWRTLAVQLGLGHGLSVACADACDVPSAPARLALVALAPVAAGGSAREAAPRGGSPLGWAGGKTKMSEVRSARCAARRATWLRWRKCTNEDGGSGDVTRMTWYVCRAVGTVVGTSIIRGSLPQRVWGAERTDARYLSLSRLSLSLTAGPLQDSYALTPLRPPRPCTRLTVGHV